MEPLLLDPHANREDEVVGLAKLVFLARIREYDPFSSSEDAIRILGSDEVSVDVFDRWWTLRSLDYELSFETMIRLFLQPLRSKIAVKDDACLAQQVEHVLSLATKRE